ncbi:putative type II secretion system protein E [Planctomycetes bacterium CA13]|uniref:Putative type II secretion system protein E n=1 Tax=Novipirellula herctigrandis TaxID=2527986 RepID=A0A5C5Z9G8_9BACT|nr:putative type II secretion system protein E [Planctomycetes bacterium CA13]
MSTTPAFPIALAVSSNNGAEFSDGFDQDGFAILAPSKSSDIVETEVGDESRLSESDVFDSDEVLLDEAKRYAKHYLLPLFDPPANEPLPVRPNVGESLPSKWCFENRVAPLSDDGETIEVAITKPDSLLLADEIRTLSGRQMRPFFAPSSVVDRLLNLLYTPDLVLNPNEIGPASEASPTKEPSKTPSIAVVGSEAENDSQLLSRILRHLVQGIVEQILIEPRGRTFQIRARHGSGLYELETLSRSAGKNVLTQILSRVGLEADASRKDFIASGQTGEFRVRYGDRRVPLRATFCPTAGGVMVTIVRGAVFSTAKHLREIGLQTAQHDSLRNALQRKNGLIVIAGPRRSGKTTTFYSALADTKTPARHVCSIEDAASVVVDGVNQVSLCELPGFTKPDAIELVLTQLPDVVAIDRLDDRDSVAMVSQLAAEGCLVIATIDSRDAASAVVRLEQLGMDHAAQASLLVGIVAQTRVGRLCAQCRHETPLSLELALKLGVESDANVAWPTGCSTCAQTGYKGSVTAYEVIPVDQSTAKAIREVRDTEAFYASAVSAGLPMIGEMLRSHVLAGDVSADVISERP